MKKFLPPIIFTVIIFSSCMQKKKADLIVHNAIVYTVDTAFNIAQSFVVKDGKIVAVGSNTHILSRYEADEMLDAGGKAVFPGFIDAHCHFYGYGTNLMRIDLKDTQSFEEVIERVQQQKDKKFGGWIWGRGWDQNEWEVKEFPDNAILDSLFPDVPVFLQRIDGHAALANSKALSLIERDWSKDIEGGEIIRMDGKPTGLLVDTAADTLKAAIPPLSTEEKRQALLAAQKDCFAVGLTTVSDAGYSAGETREIFRVIKQLQDEGTLLIRIYAMIDWSEENAKHFFQQGIYKDNRLNIRSFKLYTDGALGSRGALLLEAYADKPESNGLLLYKVDYLKHVADQVAETDFQLNTHSIGDSSARVVLALYGSALGINNARRWRIEHAQVIHPDDMRKFSDYKIIPSVQTTHATSDMGWAEKRLGPERVKNAYAYKSLLRSAGIIANGSDFPVEDINPLYGFYSAVSRKNFNGKPEGGFQMENALTREEALRAMTIWAAFANFEEDEKGSIQKGKFADFVILDKNIMTIEEKEIFVTKVTNTFISGKKVF
jgi:predicted amidohydrolase YtcJ